MSKIPEISQDQRIGMAATQAMQRVRRNLGEIQVVEGMQGKKDFIKLIGKTRSRIGIIKYDIQSNALNIHWIETDCIMKDYREKGVSRALIGLALIKVETTSRIHAVFGGTNIGEFAKAKWNGLGDVAAIKETPLYKACASFGFTELDWENMHITDEGPFPDGIDYSVELSLVQPS